MTAYRVLGLILGGFLGSLFGILLLTLVAVMLPALGIRWPGSHALAALAIVGIPTVLAALLGVIGAPALVRRFNIRA